jgi:hypothetical protein
MFFKRNPHIQGNFLINTEIKNQAANSSYNILVAGEVIHVRRQYWNYLVSAANTTFRNMNCNVNECDHLQQLTGMSLILML